MGQSAGVSLPPDLRALLELAFERLDMGVGQWRLEARAQDGVLLRVDRHEERIPATGLGRFDREWRAEQESA